MGIFKKISNIFVKKIFDSLPVLDSISGVLSVGCKTQGVLRVLTLTFQKPGNRENTMDFEDFIIMLATFSQGVREVLNEILKVFNTFR